MSDLMPSSTHPSGEFLFHRSEGNLPPDSVIRIFRTIAADGKDDDKSHYSHTVVKAEGCV